jgi:hypothetical protein
MYLVIPWHEKSALCTGIAFGDKYGKEGKGAGHRSPVAANITVNLHPLYAYYSTYPFL